MLDFEDEMELVAERNRLRAENERLRQEIECLRAERASLRQQLRRPNVCERTKAMKTALFVILAFVLTGCITVSQCTSRNCGLRPCHWHWQTWDKVPQQYRRGCS